MKRVCHVVFLLMLGAMPVIAQDLFNESFSQVKGSENGTIALEPSQLDNPEGWTFDKVYAGESSIIVKKGGTITLPVVPDLIYGAQFYFDIQPWIDPNNPQEEEWGIQELSINHGKLNRTDYEIGLSSLGSYHYMYDVDEESRLTLTATSDITVSSVRVWYGDYLPDTGFMRGSLVECSHESGEYNDPIDIVLTPSQTSLNMNCRTVYTLDGSTPTRTSTLHDGTPIHIEQNCTLQVASVFPNGYVYLNRYGMYESPLHIYTFLKPEVPEIPETIHKVNVTTPGQLAEQLMQLDVDFIEGLSVSGMLNGQDLKFLTSTQGLMSRLRYLDMEEVTFDYDDGLYYTYVSTPEAGMGTTHTYNYYLSETNWSETRSPSPSTSITEMHCNDLRYAFYKHPTLTQVILPKTLTSLGESILCTPNMLAVTLPEGLIEIGDDALCFGSVPYTVELPKSIEKIGNNAFSSGFMGEIDLPALKVIGNYAFADSKVSSFKFYDTLETIGKGAFSGSSLSRVEMATPPDTIKEATFEQCDRLEYVSIGEGVKCIEKNAFLYTEPDTFQLPASLVDIGPNALPVNFVNGIEPEGGIRYVGAVAYQVTENQDRYEIREGTVTLSSELFQGNPATGFIIPASVKKVGKRTFAGSGITSIPDMPGITHWPDELFYNCNNLARITIPEQVEYIGQDVFRYCNSIWQVKYEAIDATIAGGIFGQHAGRPVEFECSFTVGDKVTRIPKGVFSNNYTLTELVLPTSVEIIDDEAFSGCQNLKSIYLPDHVRKIGIEAFGYCSSLTGFHWPLYLEEVGIGAFRWCENLKEISLPEGTKVLGEGAFGKCDAVHSIYLPSTLEYIGDAPFSSTPKDKVKITSTSLIPPTPTEGDNLWNFYYTVNDVAYMRIPVESMEEYRNNPYWSRYAPVIVPIQEISAPEKKSETIFAGVINGQTDLTDTVLGDVYVTIGEEDYFDTSDNSIVLHSTISIEEANAIAGMAPGKSDVANRFDGMIVMIPAGTGSLQVNCRTTGNRQLCVMTGKGNSHSYSQATQGIISVDYNVTEDSYVYIYASEPSNQPSFMNKSRATEDCVKIYSICISPNTTGIESVTTGSTSPVEEYISIDGIRKSAPTTPGIYVIKRCDGSTSKVIIR